MMSSNKRGNIFGQGKPERPYEERDDPADVPQRATAAQLATRKIKTAKARRPAAGAPSGLSQSTNFAAPQQSGFSFGASAPAPTENGASSFAFGGNTNAFGGGATNSFPPAQPAAPSNTFTNSSFPAFGASSQSTGFNPQPPSSGFNFTASGNNPFAATSSAPATNGSTPAPAFGGASMFNAQPQSNPFGGSAQNTTTSAFPGSMFGTSSSAPSTSLFGTASAAPNTASSPAPTAPTFSFGAPSSSAQTGANTPATTSMFSGFGTPTQTAAPAQNSAFSGFGAAVEKSDANAESSTAQKNLFGSIGTTSTTATTPAPSLFSFGTTAQKSESTATGAPSTSIFGTSSSTAADASTPVSAPASNPFAKLPTTTSMTPLSGAASAPQAQETASTTNNIFSNLKPAGEHSSAAADGPAPNLFASLAKPNNTPTPASITGTPSSNLFGFAQNKRTNNEVIGKPTTGRLGVPGEVGSGVFNAFSTPQPAKTSDVEKGGLFNTQPKTSSGIFGQSFQPEKANSSIFKPVGQQSSSSTGSTQTAPKETSDPFAKLPASAHERPSLFSTEQATPATVTPATQTLTGSSAVIESTPEISKEPELPKVPKVHIPKEWAIPGAANAQNAGSFYQQILDCTAQLQALNVRYRQQLAVLPLTADWSSLSFWHYRHAIDLKKKIDSAKKQRASANGITGNESTVSKRKVNNESPNLRENSPSKRARPGAEPTTPTPPSASMPKFNPLTATSSNSLAKSTNEKLAAPANYGSTNLFAPKPVDKATTESSKAAASFTGFTPALSASSDTSASSGFKPSFSAAGTGGFKPSTGGASGGSGFFQEFAKTAKTYEELAAERKKKAKDEDYDSDDETEEQWSARYDKAEAERIAENKKKAAATPTFSVPGSSKSSDSTTPPSNPFSSLLKPASGASTPGGFTPRGASPALSANGSVFDAPSTAHTPSSNIFGHLSSAQSSNNQDESDEDEGAQTTRRSQNGQAIVSTEPTTPPEQNSGKSDSITEVDPGRKQQETAATLKGSLFSRMTRDNQADSEKENNGSEPVFGQTNGNQTPTNKPFSFFDFGAAGSKTAPPKSDTFAGDQTFKPGTPIKFGAAPATEKKSSAPLFSFQPATPSAAELSTTPAKPPPTSLFNFGASTGGSSLLAPSAGLSGAGSVPSSVFTSRAGTPLSEADTSAASAAEDDEEGSKQAQVDFAKLTEDEIKENEIIFHAEMVLAKHQVDKGDGTKIWASIAKGPLWILKDKTTSKCIIRVRLANGSTPINYQILPALKATVTGGSKKMVMASKPAQGGGFQQVLYAVRSPDIAEEFMTKYNESLPSD